MPVANLEEPAPTAAEHRSAFFRQSGWLMIANIGGGVFMWAVHFLSRPLGSAQYGIFGVLLGVAMIVPTMPLQVVLAHQTARAIAMNRRRQVVGMVRLIVGTTFAFWLVASIGVLIFQGQILDRWKFTNPMALWITLPVVLLSLWLPVFSGVLQGQQNFLWLGWSMILNGVGRLSVAVLAVFAVGAYASGMMAGVLAGLIVAVVLAAWQTRSLWTGPSLPFDWRSLLREVLPPMLAIAAFQFLFTADTMFVKGYFSGDEAGFYVSAGTLSRALMWLVGPLASVMFPRIVHSAAKAEKNDLMSMVLLGTAVLSVMGAVGLSVLGPWVVKFVSGPSFVKTASSLLPWYAGAMVPLALANVLLNNLLARSFFKVVPALCVLAGCYGFALTRFHDSLIMVLQTLTVFNTLLLLICSWFTWQSKPQATVVIAPTPAS